MSMQTSPPRCTHFNQNSVVNHSSGLPRARLTLRPQLGLCPGCASRAGWQPQPLLPPVLVLEPGLSLARFTRCHQPNPVVLQVIFSSHLQAVTHRFTVEGQAGCEQGHARLLCASVVVSLSPCVPLAPCSQGNS